MRRSPALRAAVAAVSLCAAPASAQTVPQALPGAIVTATRLPQARADVLADVVVIGRDAIERAGAALSLPELLQRAGGVEIASNGGAGQVSGVFVRGSNANHVVVLVDGVRVASATTGTNAFEHLPLEQIERIEIVRGPASSLYGADAIGGVIQIFTRAPELTSARASAGTWRTRALSAGTGRAFGSTALSLQAGASDSRGFSATNATHPFSFTPDDDGYRNRNLGLRASHEWQPGHRFALRAFASDARTEFDSGPGSDDVNRQRLATLALESSDRITPAWRSVLRIARGADHLHTSGAFPSRFATDSDQASWQNDLAAFGGTVVAGIEWRREKVASDTAYTNTKRSIGSLFGGWSGRLFADAHLLQASLRHDDNSQFGGRSSGNLAYGWRITPALRLSAAAGSAFKAPSFNDLYFPLAFGFQGNPLLAPERSRNVEAGARYEQGGMTASATLFANRIRDLIAVDPTFTTVVNVNRARSRGLTLNAGLDNGVWHARAEATWQDAEDADSGLRLVRRARHYASAGAGATFGGWRGELAWVGSGARFDAASNAPASRMGGYGLLDALLAYALTRELSLSARVVNAADKRYELAQGYNTPPRALFVMFDYAAQR